VAILTFVVAQIWLSFFKKWEYNANCAEDFGEADYLQSLTQEEFATANCADSAQKTASEDAKDVVDSEESEEKPATKAGKQQNN